MDCCVKCNSFRAIDSPLKNCVAVCFAFRKVINKQASVHLFIPEIFCSGNKREMRSVLVMLRSQESNVMERNWNIYVYREFGYRYLKKKSQNKMAIKNKNKKIRTLVINDWKIDKNILEIFQVIFLFLIFVLFWIKTSPFKFLYYIYKWIYIYIRTYTIEFFILRFCTIRVEIPLNAAGWLHSRYNWCKGRTNTRDRTAILDRFVIHEGFRTISHIKCWF